MQIGQNVARLRMQAGLSQAQLADVLFVSRELVSKWETGLSRPGRKMIEAMASFFAVTTEELIDRHAVLSQKNSGDNVTTA